MVIVMSFLFFILWAMIEAVLLGFEGWKQMQENANMWFVNLGLAALAFLLLFISAFVGPVLLGIGMLFVALGQIFPVILPFLPKVELKK